MRDNGGKQDAQVIERGKNRNTAIAGDAESAIAAVRMPAAATQRATTVDRRRIPIPCIRPWSAPSFRLRTMAPAESGEERLMLRTPLWVS